MSQTRDDLREALALASVNLHRRQTGNSIFASLAEARAAYREDMQKRWLAHELGRADALIAGPLAQVSALQAEVERLQKVEGDRDAALSALKALLRDILPTDPADLYAAPGSAAVEKAVRTLADLDGRLRPAAETKEGSDV